MKILLVNKYKIIKITSHCGNNFVYISQDANLFIVTLYVGKVKNTRRHERLITAYNSCVANSYEESRLELTSTENNFLIDVGIMLEILTPGLYKQFGEK